MKYFLVVILFVLLFSCKKENNDVLIKPINMDYYPAFVGEEIEYNVEEINIDKQVGVNDTTRYSLKEFFESSFIDDEGNTNYRIERYTKSETDTVWKILNIWYVSISNSSIYKTEDNYRYKRLIFPLKDGSTWDGNIENTKDTEEYEITSLDVSEIIGDNNYSNVLTVLQNDNENLIEKQFSTEKYVKNIGLAFKQIIDISELEPQPGIPWEQRINVGYIYIQTIK